MLYLSLGSIFVFKVRIKNHKGQHCYHNDHIDDSDPSFFIALSAPRIPVSKQIGTKVKANLIEMRFVKGIFCQSCNFLSFKKNKTAEKAVDLLCQRSYVFSTVI